jgi:hypothetical protein
MRRRLARLEIGTLALVFSLLSLGLAPDAGAGGPASSGEQWDDSHMQSNFAHRRGPAPPRPAVQGTDRYHQATSAPAPTPPVGVAETTLRISQHEWSPGGASSGARTGASLWGSSTSSGGGASARPTVSSGVRTSSGVRLSTAGEARSRR